MLDIKCPYCNEPSYEGECEECGKMFDINDPNTLHLEICEFCGNNQDDCICGR